MFQTAMAIVKLVMLKMNNRYIKDASKPTYAFMEMSVSLSLIAELRLEMDKKSPRA
jgi:hypothetical protein